MAQKGLFAAAADDMMNKEPIHTIISLQHHPSNSYHETSLLQLTPHVFSFIA
jgi:hypothetical protein